MILCARSSVSAVARDRGSGIYLLGLGPWRSEGSGWKCLNREGWRRKAAYREPAWSECWLDPEKRSTELGEEGSWLSGK